MFVCWTAMRSVVCLRRLAPVALLSTILAGAFEVGTAVAQPLTLAELDKYSVQQMIVLAQNAQAVNRCQDFETLLGALRLRSFNLGRAAIDTSLDQGRAERAERRLKAEGCPRRTVSVDLRQVGMLVGGGATWVDIPQVKGGTQFDPIAGREIPIARSANTLTGAGGHFFATIPTNQNTLWGDYFYINASGSGFDGKGSGSVPIGGNNVAFTYLFPNPSSGSTGIFAGATGQQVHISSDGHLIDVSLGLKGVTPLPGPPGPPGNSFFQQFDLHTTAGFRYRNFDLSHTIDQQSLFFPDLHSQIGLDQSSNFFGAQFGVGLLSRPPRPQGGFVGGIHAFVAPGVLSTSATANQFSHCGPCGIASPEYDVSLQRGFNDSRFSVIVGGTVHLGYQFNASTGMFVKGTVEHMTDVPFFQVPTTPVEQPIFIDYGASTNASVMAGFRFVFDPAEVLTPSDIRLKRDVTQIGRLANGLKLYRYRYLWSDTVYVGVMAQEVAAVMPEAVMRGADGYLRVDYARLGLRLITWDQWRFPMQAAAAEAAG